ncbi:DDE-type integrase/transposase/recombinase [Paracoccus sp. IB05]|uniref:DDE-type integrase/transposase/recombinase n=1 Tax=Paracoccus sp. IB05 TaxID=2779367 RepID=UPI00351C36E6
MADFTYIRTVEGWLCIAVVLDLLSRRAAGCPVKADGDASQVMDAFMMALWRRGGRCVAPSLGQSFT